MKDVKVEFVFGCDDMLMMGAKIVDCACIFLGFFELLCKNGGHRLLLRLYVLYICCYMKLFAAVVVIYGNKKLSCR